MVDKPPTSSTPWMGQQAHYEGPRVRRVHISPQLSSSPSPNSHPSTRAGSNFNHLSVHVTQLNYEATREQIAAYFEASECSVKSCRVVVHGGKSKGVAFVDLDDQASMNRAMKLHRSMFMGRRINVRKTLAPEQLQKIVEAREKKLADRIMNRSIDEPKLKKRKRNGSKFQDDDKKKRKHNKDNGRSSKKLTKSERARKAAIIRKRS